MVARVDLYNPAAMERVPMLDPFFLIVTANAPPEGVVEVTEYAPINVMVASGYHRADPVAAVTVPASV